MAGGRTCQLPLRDPVSELLLEAPRELGSNSASGIDGIDGIDGIVADDSPRSDTERCRRWFDRGGATYAMPSTAGRVPLDRALVIDALRRPARANCNRSVITWAVTNDGTSMSISSVAGGQLAGGAVGITGDVVGSRPPPAPAVAAGGGGRAARGRHHRRGLQNTPEFHPKFHPDFHFHQMRTIPSLLTRTKSVQNK